MVSRQFDAPREGALEKAAEAALVKTLGIAETLNYAGHSKHDGLNAPWLEALAGNRRWTRLLFIQLIMRCPFHVRPWLGVAQARNAKGLALFSRALLARYRLNRDVDALEAARSLLDWLCENSAPGFELPCWGYPYPWQDVGFFSPRHFPNRVVTSFVANALLDGYETIGDERYLEAAGGAVEFLLTAPRTLYENRDHRCVSYVPTEDVDWIVMDVSALCGAVAARYGRLVGDENSLVQAGRLLRYVVSKQTDYGAWYYAEPPSASHITHDNYHTGFILDSILTYATASGSGEFDDAYEKGLQYYQTHLFEADGAPRFMNNRKYPFDIHGAAQGIITFSLAEHHLGKGKAVADRALDWTLREMFDSETGWFYYQKRGPYRSRIRLLRWCQAWMAMALASYLEIFAATERPHGNESAGSTVPRSPGREGRVAKN